jgi:hypothetical protein
LSVIFFPLNPKLLVAYDASKKSLSVTHN